MLILYYIPASPTDVTLDFKIDFHPEDCDPIANFLPETGYTPVALRPVASSDALNKTFMAHMQSLSNSINDIDARFQVLENPSASSPETLAATQASLLPTSPDFTKSFTLLNLPIGTTQLSQPQLITKSIYTYSCKYLTPPEVKNSSKSKTLV